MSYSIFVTGGTGYIGSRLIPRLVQRGHRVKGLVRKGSEQKLPAGVETGTGDALQFDSYTKDISPADTFVHLIGVPHPSPAKARQFQEIDLVSIQVALKAARAAGIQHFVYLSVAQPAPMMKAFIEVRHQGEEMLSQSGMKATFVRPWYVLGPGHRWAYIAIPFYWIFERLPATREGARRLGLVTIDQMLNALIWAIENPPNEIRVLDVPRIKTLPIIRAG